MGYAEFSRNAEIGQRLIADNGITYNVYGDPKGKERPWRLDPVPLVLGSAEWAQIERAIIQRATLLNTILADLYGPQTLVHNRLLPPELVLGNPSFLRACHRVTSKRGVYLHNYAVDLARAPNGAWWVIADRTQAPSGLGYALENRIVTARTLPALVDVCHVKSLARFYDDMFEALLALAPNDSASPRLVVLTAGPHNETYFEHSYLSKHWRVPLVGGSDLTVRDGRVFLKTLAGLSQVDVIVRRMDDDFCDPLELRGDSLLGVPGLVHASRVGNVFIANCLGSGLVETPALLAFLPGLCQQLLAEPLHLPSVATWWCGQDGPRRAVLDNLERLVIKPTFSRLGQRAEFPAMMSAEARRTLGAHIEARPAQFVAQEQVDLSTVPILTHRGLEPRHVVLRALAAWDGSSYAVLPGGLTRVATGGQSLVVSMQLGGGSKDTWIVGHDDRTIRRSLGDDRPAPPEVASTELSSRVADNLFWLGRYAERLEAMSRLIRVLLPGVSGETTSGRAVPIETALHFLRGLDLLPRDLAYASVAPPWWRLQTMLGQLVLDPSHPWGLAWNAQQIRRLSWEVKERLSQDTWRVLQQLERAFAAPPGASADRPVVAALKQLDDVVIMLSAFAGLLSENPTRGHGWRFLDIGRRIERALQMLGLLRVGVATAPFPDDPYLEVLLQVADSATTYRSRYLTAIRTRFVLELMLADEAYPRSVAYQLAALHERILGLPEPDTGGRETPERVLPSQLLAVVRNAGVDSFERDTKGRRSALDAELGLLRNGVLDIANALTARYLSHSVPSRLTPST
jgi:uncharacterized circularly permuted ATP-grasp superfamily protein/uncharacterized alpha-E superfamily protein